MWARVSHIKGSPDRVESGIRNFKEAVIPAGREMAGFKGGYLLVERESGRFMGITLWETEEALRKSVEAANRLRAQAAETAAASEPPIVEVYEVAVEP